MISFWLYDPHSNVALQQNVDLDDVQFYSSAEHNFFRIEEPIEGSMVVTATDGEFLSMNDVTPEQIVILFSTVRGLKEAARE
jgi:hypothetical protein